MASTLSSLPFVQNTYTDNWTRLYPGQVVDAQTMFGVGLDTYANEEAIVMGRGVRIGVDQTQNTPSQIPFVATAPFSITNVAVGTTATDLIGVAVRPFVTTTNIDVNGVNQAGYPEKDFAAILPFGSRRTIGVRIPPGFTIAVNEDVYIALDATNDAGDIEVGEFANNSGGVTGLLLVPNAKWWINKTATTDDDIGVIKLF